MLLILSCETMYCYRKDFTGYIYHVGNASELNFMIRNGLILGGKSLKRGRQAVFCTIVNPMEDGYGMEVNSTRSDEIKDRAIQEYLESPSNYFFWCNLKLAQEKGLQFYQTRSHAVVLYNTLPAACGGMYEDTGRAPPKSSLNSRSATGCTQIELAIRSTRSTKPRRKIILGPIKRFEELR